jgi:DNA-binding transcriptional LysR family regulator
MNLNHLALFLAVAEEGSVSRGAARLHVSQPAVSKQITEFESSLGVRLFDRIPKGVRLTEAGELLLDHARRLFAVEADAERAISELKGLERGRLSLGASTTIGSYLLPNSLARFHRQHPSVEVEMRIGNTHEIQAALRARTVDVGFTEGFADEDDLDAVVFHTDELVAVVVPEHPLAQSSAPVSGTRLMEEPLILREAGSGTREVLEWALASIGVAVPPPALTLSGTEAIKRAVTAGAGVAVVSRLAVEDEIAAGRLVALTLSSNLAALLRRPLHRLRLKGMYEGRAVQAFLRTLERP